MDITVGGAPRTRKRERVVRWLLALRAADGARFASLPDDRQDMDDARRADLAALYGEMVAARLYLPLTTRERCKLPDRLFVVRGLVREARERA